MANGTNKKYKQFTISTQEDACLVLKSLLVPVIIDLEKFKNYSKEAAELLQRTRSNESVSAQDYESIHDKVLYQQRELLRFIADHQTTSFSYIEVRQLLVKRGYLKRELDEENRKILNELLDIRNWSFHNAQSMIVADMEIAKKSIPPELKGYAEIKPLLNPVIIRKVKTYSREILAGFIDHNAIRIRQFESILDEMKKDYQSMYESLSDDILVMTGMRGTQEITYLDYEVDAMDSKCTGANIASLSMGIQKGKYDGSDEAYEKWCSTDGEYI